MKNLFRNFLTFNKRERNGVFVLLSIILLLVLYLNIAPSLVKQDKTGLAIFEKDLVNFERSLKSQKTSTAHGGPQEDPAFEFVENKMEVFDPNELSEKEWSAFGLSDKQIRTIKNFRAKGGRFNKKEDLKKIYGITTGLYQRLEPFIQIKDKNERTEEIKNVFKDGKVEQHVSSDKTHTQKIVLLDLNSADSVDLLKIKGVGPFFAKQILKYRNALGGFVSKEQLLEVWKLDQEKYNMIEKFVFVDIGKAKKVCINTCEASELKSPYVRWNVANAIVNYRKQHGKYNSIEEIKRTDLVDDETYRKIVPYLKLD